MKTTSSWLLTYLREMVRLTYWFWFKPFTLRNHMRLIAGEADFQSRLLHLIAQLTLGALVSLTGGRILVEWVNVGLLGNAAFDWPLVLSNVVFGVVLSIVFGVVFGVAVGVVFGIVFGVAFGFTDGIAFGVAFGIAFGVAFGVAFGIADGITLSVVVGVEFVIVVGVAIGVALGIMVGITVGIVFGVTLIVMYAQDILDAPLWYSWATVQWMRVRANPTYAKIAFAHSPIQFDEWIRLPLPFFDRFVIACIQANPSQREIILAQVANVPGQVWAACRIRLQLLLADMGELDNLDMMAATALNIRALTNNYGRTDNEPKRNLLNSTEVWLLDRLEKIAEELNLVTGTRSRYTPSSA